VIGEALPQRVDEYSTLTVFQKLVRDPIRYLNLEGHELTDDTDTLDIRVVTKTFAIEVLRLFESHSPSDEREGAGAVAQRFRGRPVSPGLMPLVLDPNRHRRR